MSASFEKSAQDSAQDSLRKIRGADPVPFTDHHGAFDRVAQLADVPRPRIFEQKPDCVGLETVDVPLIQLFRAL